MSTVLKEINVAVHEAGGQLTTETANAYRGTYRRLLAEAEVECPPPDTALHKGKRGRQKRSIEGAQSSGTVDQLREGSPAVYGEPHRSLYDQSGRKKHSDDQGATEDIGLLSIPRRRTDVLSYSGISFDVP